MLGLAGHQAVVMHSEARERSAKSDLAERTARSLGKPFLVVGGPWGDNPFRKVMNIQYHACGDFCVDLDPEACSKCDTRFVQADIRDLPFANKQMGAVLCSHVLEHMPSAQDCSQAWRELHRVAERVFICVPSKQSVIAWLVPDHYLWVQEVGTRTLKVEERRTGKTFLVRA